MDRDEATRVLCEHGWLSTLPPTMREDWLGGARLIQFSKGEHVFAVQEEPHFMLGLADGTVGAVLSYHPQETRLMMLYEVGNWLGDAAIISQSVHRGTAVARTDCTCLLVPASHVDAVASRHPEIWRRIAVNVLVQFDSYTTLTEAALNRDPTCRLITMLLSLKKLNPRQSCFDLSTEEIGQMVGLTRNTVSNCLRELEREGLVQRGYARLSIVSNEQLEAELARRSLDEPS